MSSQRRGSCSRSHDEGSHRVHGCCPVVPCRCTGGGAVSGYYYEGIDERDLFNSDNDFYRATGRRHPEDQWVFDGDVRDEAACFKCVTGVDHPWHDDGMVNGFRGGGAGSGVSSSASDAGASSPDGSEET